MSPCDADARALDRALGIENLQHPDVAGAVAVASEREIVLGVAGNLTAPLFNGGKLRAERRAAEAGRKVAIANYEQTVLTAFGQVADVLAALEHDAQLTTASHELMRNGCKTRRN